ncbi:MAG: acetylglutamate kinase [Actinobacteria bacterium]|nr:acetylglutamate kinase [Actinomycetota bacterium]
MIVVKFGGHAMEDENGNFAKAISAALKAGEQVVVVHGGGPQIDAALKAKEITSEWIGGFRVTTQEIFDVVEDVLVNHVGIEVAATLGKAGIKAQAMSARTLPTLIANRRTQLIDGTLVDLGLVGNVQRVNPSALLELLDQGIVPVVAPVSSDEDMTTGLNVNADFAAAAIAAALGASSLIVMTDVAGIYRNWPDKKSLIESISALELESIKSGFAEGMAPKVQAALDALSFGAKAVRIIDGTDPDSFASALAGQGGTLVVA